MLAHYVVLIHMQNASRIYNINRTSVPTARLKSKSPQLYFECNSVYHYQFILCTGNVLRFEILGYITCGCEVCIAKYAVAG